MTPATRQWLYDVLTGTLATLLMRLTVAAGVAVTTATPDTIHQVAYGLATALVALGSELAAQYAKRRAVAVTTQVIVGKPTPALAEVIAENSAQLKAPDKPDPAPLVGPVTVDMIEREVTK